jgi:hypothetical protein
VADDYAAELESLAAELRRQADGKLFASMTKAMRDGVEPAQQRIRAGIPDYIPKRGGYAATVAGDLDLPISVSTTGKEPGVSISARAAGQTGGRHGTGRRRYKRLDGGVLWHPVFGDRDNWKEQAVTPGFFTVPCEDAEPEVTRNLAAALQDVADEVDRKAAGR